jgi:hypothetical protein
MIWVDIMNDNKCPYMYVVDGTYKHSPHQDAVFYVQDSEDELVMKVEDIPIIRYGYLRFWLPEKQIALRTTEALVKAGIYHDKHLEFHREQKTFEELEVPKFLVLSSQGKESFRTLDEALQCAYRINTLEGSHFNV